MERKIVHLDMDAFFASVEQRDNPQYRGRPLIVGGAAESRGVVAAASYEARQFGIRSAMASKEAVRRCPDAIFVFPRIAVYRRISKVIMSILREFTDLVEPLSLDEAYMDVSRTKQNYRYASQVAREARKKIFEYTGLTASAGVAPNKFLAKIASDINKPDGMKVIRPEEAQSFLATLPVRSVPGVGRVMEEKMARIGVLTVGHLQGLSEEALRSHFGKQAEWFYAIARGQDDRPVVAARERKSIGSEDTFERDTTDKQFLMQKIQEHTRDVVNGLEKNGVEGKTVTLKIKYGNFRRVSRSKTFLAPTGDMQTIYAAALGLLDSVPLEGDAVRLLGVSVSNLHAKGFQQGVNELQLCLEF